LQVNVVVWMLHWKSVYRCINCNVPVLRTMLINIVVSSGFSKYCVNTFRYGWMFMRLYPRNHVFLPGRQDKYHLPLLLLLSCLRSFFNIFFPVLFAVIVRICYW
jgi:hypothetical protein